METKKGNRKMHFSLEKLENERKDIHEEFNKLDNRTNAFLAVSLGIYSLEITLLVNTIKVVFEKKTVRKNIIIITVIAFITIAVIIVSLSSVINFRKSIATSENRCSNRNNLNEFIKGISR